MDTRQKKRPGKSTGRPAARKTGKAPVKRSSPAPTKRARPASVQRTRTAPEPRQNPTRRRRKQSATPEVVYTPAAPFNRGKLLLQLVSIVAVVLALSFGISIFFKVKNITVSGAEKYSAWAVREASGIQDGDNLLTFGKAKACGQITAKLPYVKSVRIGIKLPDTVNIEIVEFDVVYSVRDTNDTWWLITSEGRVVEKTDSATAGEYTKLLGFALADPKPGQNAVAAEAPSSDTQVTLPEGETEPTEITVPVTVTGRERLQAALSILQYLEDSNIIGEIVSVDLTDLGKIEMWYGQQYQIQLGDTTQLSYKIKCMKQAVDQLKDYESGVLDVSFTIMENQPMYTPFPAE